MSNDMTMAALVDRFADLCGGELPPLPPSQLAMITMESFPTLREMSPDAAEKFLPQLTAAMCLRLQRQSQISED